MPPSVLVYWLVYNISNHCNEHIQGVLFLLFFMIFAVPAMVLEVLPSAVRQEKEIKGNNLNWKGRSKTVFIHRQHDHWCRKFDGIYNEAIRADKFNKVTGYKISMQKLIIFLHIKQQSETEI